MEIEKPITIIGCGPGATEYLTEAGRMAARKADCRIGSKKLLRLFADCGGEQVEIGAGVDLAINEIGKRYGKGKVAVLVSGDPGVCSLAKPIIKKFGIENCHVIPGISSVQLAFARLGVEWYDARIISAHNSDPEIAFLELAKEKKIAVLAGREGAIAWIARLAEEIGTGYDIYVCEELSTANEKITKVAPKELDGYKASTMAVALFIGRELGK